MERIAQDKIPAGAVEKRVTLDKLKFNMIPEDLPQPKAEEDEELDYQTASDIFRRAYRSVYNKWPNVSLGKDWEKVVCNAHAAKMSLHTFLVFAIAGYKLTHPHTPFFISNVTAPSSVDRIQVLRTACLEKFNAEDAESLGIMLDIVLDNIDDYMLASEVAFGKWITGQKLLVSGNSTPDFYHNCELNQNVYWLAIEPTYHDAVLVSFLRQKFGTFEEQKHRFNVLKAIGLLKRKATLASTIFNCRTRIMHKALKSVLSSHALTEDCFTHPDEVVYEAYPFWNGLGLALQHYEALKAVQGKRHRLWHL